MSSSGRLQREVDRAVLAVVVEAFEAADVADGRLGDDDAFETLRHLVGLGLGGLDHRDAHEVAHRHDADEPRVFDDRDVAVAVLRQGRERRRALRRRGRPCTGSAVIHSDTLARRRVGTGRGDADHVAFGEDADRPLVGVDDDDRTDVALAHAGRGVGERLGGPGGHDRMAHDVADGALPLRAVRSCIRPCAWTSRSDLPGRRHDRFGY